MKCSSNDCLNCRLKKCLLEIPDIRHIKLTPEELKLHRKERRRKYYLAHREQCISYARQYNKDHVEQVKQYNLNYKEKHKNTPSAANTKGQKKTYYLKLIR